MKINVFQIIPMATWLWMSHAYGALPEFYGVYANNKDSLVEIAVDANKRPQYDFDPKVQFLVFQKNVEMYANELKIERGIFVRNVNNPGLDGRQPPKKVNTWKARRNSTIETRTKPVPGQPEQLYVVPRSPIPAGMYIIKLGNKNIGEFFVDQYQVTRSLVHGEDCIDIVVEGGWASYGYDLDGSGGKSIPCSAAEEAQLKGMTPTAMLTEPKLIDYIARTGKVLFDKNCASCHGQNGEGKRDKQVLLAPILRDTDWLYGGSINDIYTSIMGGRQAVMASHKDALTAAEIDTLAKAVATGKPTSTPLFVEKGCTACHGPEGKGVRDMGSANLTDNIWRFDGSIKEIKRTITFGVNNGEPQARTAVMASYQANGLSDAQIKILSVYVHKFGGGENEQRITVNVEKKLKPESVEAKYIINGGEVTDNRSRLIWRRCVEGMVYSGHTCIGVASNYSYEDALQHAKSEVARTGIDWRVPKKNELASIIDKSYSSPTIDPIAFPSTPANSFWSATPVSGPPNLAFNVNFDNGNEFASSGGQRHYVRLVRVGQNMSGSNTTQSSAVPPFISADAEKRKTILDPALFKAVKEGNFESAKTLLSKGADANAKDGNGNAPLAFAIDSKNAEIVRMLLDNGADANARNNNGRPVLLLAAVLNDLTEIAKMLLDKGVDANVKDDNGNAALVFAVDRKKPEIVKMLLDKGADVNTKNDKGRSVLIAAVLNEQAEVVSMLLDKGVDVNAKINPGYTALDIAMAKGNTGIVKLLKDKVVVGNAK